MIELGPIKIPIRRARPGNAPEFSTEYSDLQVPNDIFELPPEVKASLSPRERELLALAESVVESVGSLYLAQKGNGPRATFYPPDATKEEIRKADKENPEILSHFTVVKRNEEGKLIAVPMHEEYKSAIEERRIYRNLANVAQAAQRAGDIWSYIYLRMKADAMIHGTHKEAERAWLQRPDEPTVDIVLGFYDDYTDKLFGEKYSWEGWVDVLDKRLTEESQSYLNTFAKWASQNLHVPAPKIKMRVGHTTRMAGQAARLRWQGNSLPCPIEWREEMGSKFVIFEPIYRKKFIERVLPGFKSAIDPNRRVGVSDSLVMTAQRRNLIGHEASHSFVPRGVDRRLQSYAASLKELFCNLLSIQGYSYMPGDIDKITDKEREVTLGLIFSEGVLDYADYYSWGIREDYHKGSSTMLKYCLDRGSVRIEGGRITWEEPKRVVSDLHDLFTQVYDLLKSGNVRQAKRFFDGNCDLQAYRPVIFKETKPELSVRDITVPYKNTPQGAPEEVQSAILLSLGE